MKIKIALLLVFLLANNIIFCQINNPFGNGSYLGLGYGFGSTLGKSTLAQPNINNDQGEYFCKTRDWGMDFAFSPIGGKDQSGLKFGFYFAGTLGGSNSSYYVIDPNYLDRTKYWKEGFEALINLKLGLQTAYYIKEKQTLIGLRYFNCYAGDALRASYSNSDDAAVLGLFFANDRIGLDLNFASQKIPGFLVNSEAWNYLQFNSRFKLTNGDDFALYAGLRYEHSVLQSEKSLLIIDGTQKATCNSFFLTVGFAVNTLKRDKK